MQIAHLYLPNFLTSSLVLIIIEGFQNAKCHNIPVFFLTAPGDPPIPWQKWKELFAHYARVCGSSLSAERKTSLLMHCLGSEGQEVFGHLPELSNSDSDSLNEYEICVKKIDLHYLPKISTVLER